MAISIEVMIEKWLLSLPLYSPEKITASPSDIADSLLLYKGKFDTFCPGCNKDSTFSGVASPEHIRLKEKAYLGHARWRHDYVYKEAWCGRGPHRIYYMFTINEESVIKIGQYPSLADFATADTAAFKNALSKTQLKELNKGIGLAAHGVGVGSYVYLRRVFESLVEEAHAIAISDSGWNEEAYQKSRMKERIQLLAHHLPEFLVKHPALYSLLSKGLHELTEEECLVDFDKLKSAIFVIAEEKLSNINRKKRIQEASKFLSS